MGPSPKWDRVIWRRTVDANGTVIEDIGVNFGDRRATLFRRLPRRTDIKTTFWYCDDAEVMLSWRSKYFQKGPDREPLRVKIPDLPDVFVVSVESDNTGRVVSRCREAGYSHPNAITFPSRKRIAREVQSALIRAAAVLAQVLLDNDEDIDTNPGDVWGHRVVRKPKYTQKVAAPVGYSGVRWLVDTGCPMDLVGLGDLKGPDRALIAKGGHTHALHTANGATRTAGRVDADVGNLDEVIEAHVFESTPSIISVGKRCMDTGYRLRLLQAVSLLSRVLRVARWHWMSSTTCRTFLIMVTLSSFLPLLMMLSHCLLCRPLAWHIAGLKPVRCRNASLC